MELSVVIPTRDRCAILIEALTRLERESDAVAFEVLVVDDGSTDGTPEAVREVADASALAIRLIPQSGEGPSAARNRALAVARAPVCLFLNDDSWARPGLVARHAAFHAADPRPEAALLGAVVVPPDPPPTPFMRWLGGVLFDYEGIADPSDAGGARFFTANVSAKIALVRAAGGFDEKLRTAAHEDIDLGLRLEQRGMRLTYDPAAVVEHWHPMDLASTIERMRDVGRALKPFAERHPTWPVPRRPGLRHRVKAGVLTALSAAGVRSPRLQREVWRFLCHEAAREGYWSAVEGRPTQELRVGRRLARQATPDEVAALPPQLALRDV